MNQPQSDKGFFKGLIVGSAITLTSVGFSSLLNNFRQGQGEAGNTAAASLDTNPSSKHSPDAGFGELVSPKTPRSVEASEADVGMSDGIKPATSARQITEPLLNKVTPMGPTSTGLASAKIQAPDGTFVDGWSVEASNTRVRTQGWITSPSPYIQTRESAFMVDLRDFSDGPIDSDQKLREACNAALEKFPNYGLVEGVAVPDLLKNAKAAQFNLLVVRPEGHSIFVDASSAHPDSRLCNERQLDPLVAATQGGKTIELNEVLADKKTRCVVALRIK